MINNNPWNSAGIRPCLKDVVTANGTVVEKVATIDCIGAVFNNVVNTALVLAGAIALIIILIAAFRFVTSRGNPEAVEGARKLFIYALLGLVIIFLAYGIINLVLKISFGNENVELRDITTPQFNSP